VTKTGFGVAVADGLVEVEVRFDEEDVELVVLGDVGAGAGSTTVAVTSAVTVAAGLVTWTVFVASADALLVAPPSTLITE
jgi:hypothetical protein